MTTSKCDVGETPVDRPRTQPETTIFSSMVSKFAESILNAEEFCGATRTCANAPVTGLEVAQPVKKTRARARESCFMVVLASRSWSSGGKNSARCRIGPPTVRHRFRPRPSTAFLHASRFRRRSLAKAQVRSPKERLRAPSAHYARIWPMVRLVASRTRDQDAEGLGDASRRSALAITSNVAPVSARIANHRLA